MLKTVLHFHRIIVRTTTMNGYYLVFGSGDRPDLSLTRKATTVERDQWVVHSTEMAIEDSEVHRATLQHRIAQLERDLAKCRSDRAWEEDNRVEEARQNRPGYMGE